MDTKLRDLLLDTKLRDLFLDTKLRDLLLQDWSLGRVPSKGCTSDTYGILPYIADKEKS